MSAFLGPIHYWLYNKIQIQLDLVEEIVRTGEEKNPGIREFLDTTYGESERRPLEEVIDQGNIHGWLQGQVSQSEYKLAYLVNTVIGNGSLSIEQIKEIFRAKGNEVSSDLKSADASKLFKGISDSLLDGMPCDHANMVLEDTPDRVSWERNTCVHKQYWDELGGDIRLFYEFRDAFIEGFLSGTAYRYEKGTDNTYRIERSA